MKRIVLTALAAALPFVCLFATTFYVAANGNDNNNGVTQNSAWKTLAKVQQQMANFQPGDQILFRRGDTFRGGLNITKSGTAGSPIVFGAFGTGDAPIMHGGVDLLNWVSAGANIWKTEVIPAPESVWNLASNVSVVVQNGAMQPLGRTPNFNSFDGGYLRYENHDDNSFLQDDELPPGNWVGAECLVRKAWILDRMSVTGMNSATELALENGVPWYAIKDGGGYFLQNHVQCLDQNGEWAYDKNTATLYFFSTGGAPTGVSFASVKDVFTIDGAFKFLTIKDLAFEQARQHGLYIWLAADVSVENCSFLHCGFAAVEVARSQRVSVLNCAVRDCPNNGIRINVSYDGPTPILSTDCTIKGCTVENIALRAGMGQSQDGNHFAVTAVGDGMLVENNRVLNVGMHGIVFSGNNSIVRRNLVNGFAQILNDNGGIYCGSHDDVQHTGSVITENIILNGIGCSFGSDLRDIDGGNGIYLDAFANHYSVTKNTVAHVGNGLFLNLAHHNLIQQNLIFDATEAGMHMSNGFVTGFNMSNNAIEQNTFAALREGAFLIAYEAPIENSGAATAMKNYATFKQNTYVHPFKTQGQFRRIWDFWSRRDHLSKAEWLAWSGEQNPVFCPTDSLPLTDAYSFSTQNLAQNGSLDQNLNGWDCWGFGQNASCGSVWLASGNGMDGGHAQLAPGSGSTEYLRFFQPIGPVSAGDKLLIEFSAKNTRSNGDFNIEIHDAASYGYLNEAFNKGAEADQNRHDNIFLMPIHANSANARLDLGFAMESSDAQNRAWLDNIRVRKAVLNSGRLGQIAQFEFNATDAAKTVSVSGQRLFPDGSAAPASLVLQPWTGVVLYEKNGWNPPPPANDKLFFSAGSATADPGETILLPVKVADFKNVGTFQFTLKLSGAQGAKISGVENLNLPDLDATDFFQADDQTLTCFWLDEDVSGETKPDSTVIFNVKIELGPLNGACANLQFGGSPTPISATSILNGTTTNLQVLTSGGSACTNAFYKIEGAVFKPNFAGGVSGVLVSSGFDSKTTAADGKFALNSELGHDYTISASKNANPLDGVTVLDLALLREHILGQNPLNSPYKLAAADVDGSASITGADALAMKSLLLGKIQQFPNGVPSWRFVSTVYDFPNPLAPWGFPETFDVINVSGNIIDRSFFGIKMGDLNNDAQGMMPPPSNNLIFKMLKKTFLAGQTLEVPLLAKGFSGVSAWQFDLKFDPNLLHFDSATAGNLPGIEADNFGLDFLQQGLLPTFWIDPTLSSNGVSLLDDTTLLTLHFTTLADGAVSETSLGISENRNKAIAYDGSDTALGIQFLFENTSDAPELLENQSLGKVSAQPNPFSENTRLLVSLPENFSGEEIRLSVFDLYGKLVFEKSGVARADGQVFEIGASEILGSGVFVCRLECETWQGFARICKID